MSSLLLSLPVFIPAVCIVLAIPMAAGIVPPNWFYGFRTRKTLSDPRIWYAANRYSGFYLLAAGTLSLAVWCFLAMKVGSVRAAIPGELAMATFLLASVVASFVRLNRM